MSVIKHCYTTKDKIKHETGRWYITFTDHHDIRRRIPGHKERRIAEAMERNIVKLVRYKLANELPDANLRAWVEGLPMRMRMQLARFGLLDAEKVAAMQPLMDHLEGTADNPGYKQYLLAKGNEPHHVRTVVTRVKYIIRGCRFTFWNDISPTKLLNYLHERRQDTKRPDGSVRRGISAQTFNFYIAAFKAFSRWMIRDRRATQNLVEHVETLNVRLDRRHDRRPLDVQEVLWLLVATHEAPVRYGMTGPERAILYRLAVETGLRANELATLTKGAFDLNSDHPSVTVKAAFSKHRRDDVVLLRPAMAQVLRSFLEGRSAGDPVFNMPKKLPMVHALRKDLADARSAYIHAAGDDVEERRRRQEGSFLAYCNEQGLYADFHALRHTQASLLVASRVSPKVAQTLTRHSDINLTMMRYAHLYRGQEREAIEMLPDLGQRPPEEHKALPAPPPATEKALDQESDSKKKEPQDESDDSQHA